MVFASQAFALPCPNGRGKAATSSAPVMTNEGLVGRAKNVSAPNPPPPPRA
jgi:hypothetical protein